MWKSCCSYKLYMYIIIAIIIHKKASKIVKIRKICPQGIMIITRAGHPRHDSYNASPCHWRENKNRRAKWAEVDRKEKGGRWHPEGVEGGCVTQTHAAWHSDASTKIWRVPSSGATPVIVLFFSCSCACELISEEGDKYVLGRGNGIRFDVKYWPLFR